MTWATPGHELKALDVMNNLELWMIWTTQDPKSIGLYMIWNAQGFGWAEQLQIVSLGI